MQLLVGLGVVTEILLAANKDDGKSLAEVENLRDPLYTSLASCFNIRNHRSSPAFSSPLGSNDAGTHLLLDVVEGVWRVNRETDQDDVRVGV